MPNTRRQNILDNLHTVIEAVGTVGSAEINRIRVVDGNVTLPFVNITSGASEFIIDESDIGPTGQEVYEWEINLRVITDTTDIEQLLGDIHVAVMADESRGGYADMTLPSTTEAIEDFDQANNVQSMTITYEVKYGLPRGTTA